jgi:hypothetical protein
MGVKLIRPMWKAPEDYNKDNLMNCLMVWKFIDIRG